MSLLPLCGRLGGAHVHVAGFRPLSRAIPSRVCCALLTAREGAACGSADCWLLMPAASRSWSDCVPVCLISGRMPLSGLVISDHPSGRNSSLRDNEIDTQKDEESIPRSRADCQMQPLLGHVSRSYGCRDTNFTAALESPNFDTQGALTPCGCSLHQHSSFWRCHLTPARCRRSFPGTQGPRGQLAAPAGCMAGSRRWSTL